MALPKSMRLKGHRTFDYVHNNSVKYYGKLMTIKVAKPNKKILISHKKNDDLDKLKIAIAISKKVTKKAVERNRLRRILQDSLLKNFSKKNNHKPYWLLVNLKVGKFHNEEKELLKDFQNLLLISRSI